jgi:hypothetical protein
VRFNGLPTGHKIMVGTEIICPAVFPRWARLTLLH